VEHVLLVIPVVGDAFLAAMGRVIRAVEVQHDALRDPLPPSLLEIALDQGHRQAVAGFAVDGIL
jgi:hypothetical protein